MVLLSAAVCTKSGKALVSRNFMEVSRSRIEGLLAAFPKLIDHDGQHTFVETDSVRYVYQSMENLYMVLITTKNSNILEDLETLRLFTRVVSDCCPSLTAEEVTETAFELIFAFDEIVALGYREDVNIQQIRTYIEMDSHDENVARMIRKSKEAEQREYRKRVEKDLAVQRRARERMGLGGGMGGMGSSGMGSGSGMGGMGSGGSMGGGMGGGMGSGAYSAPAEAPAPAPARSSKKRGGLKLGSKGKKDTAFADKLMAEGQDVMGAAEGGIAERESALAGASHSSTISEVPREAFHVQVAESILVHATRDGGLEEMFVRGVISVHVSDPAYCAGTILSLELPDDKGISYNTHPNIDKKRFNAKNGAVRSVALKKNKSYLHGEEVGVVRWNYKTTESDEMPFTINLWPNIERNGTCTVNVDYELVNTDLPLEGVKVRIPVPDTPVVQNIEQGDYTYDRRNGELVWSIPTVSDDNADGALEFTIKGADSVESFFPASVSFVSTSSFAGTVVKGVQTEDGADVPLSTEVIFETGEEDKGGYQFV